MALGLALTLIAGTLVALDRSGSSLQEEFGITFFQLFGLYIMGGAVGGACFGMLLPLARWPAGAVLVGVVAATPVYFGVAVLLDVPLISMLPAPILVGGTLGYLLRSKTKTDV